MLDYKQIIEQIISSITNFSFEFDVEEVKNEMELKEVSKEELEQLGEIGVKEKFDASIFKIMMPNGSIIDVDEIYKRSNENNIKEPVVLINPGSKYVQWAVKKDLALPQLKKYIKNQLTNNTDVNLVEIQKALILEEIKHKEVVGYIDKLKIKTSSYIQEGRFYPI